MFGCEQIDKYGQWNDRATINIIIEATHAGMDCVIVRSGEQEGCYRVGDEWPEGLLIEIEIAGHMVHLGRRVISAGRVHLVAGEYHTFIDRLSYIVLMGTDRDVASATACSVKEAEAQLP